MKTILILSLPFLTVGAKIAFTNKFCFNNSDSISRVFSPVNKPTTALNPL